VLLPQGRIQRLLVSFDPRKLILNLFDGQFERTRPIQA